MQPINGISQTVGVAGICGTTFNLLVKGASCVLSLQITGSQLTTSVVSGPVVCQLNSTQCYTPNQANSLNITIGSPIPATPPILNNVNPITGTTLGGTQITLTGTNLTGTTGVTLEGIAATGITIINDTTVTAITPPHAAGSVDVTITTPSGSATLSNGFTYVVSNQPTLTSINPTSGTASGGAQVTLTGTNLTGTTAITLGGTAATGINVINDTTVTAVTPVHAAGVVDVVITTPSGSATLTNGYTYIATAVGQSSQGGTIACLGGAPFQNLIAAVADNSAAIEWGTLGVITGATSISDGATNTATIVTTLGAGNYAASLCQNYEVDSAGNSPCQAGNICYTDWFLPAQNQLDCLYTNQVAIGGFAGGAASIYWNSTEIDANSAWTEVFSNGQQLDWPKNIAFNVRCVHSFTP